MTKAELIKELEGLSDDTEIDCIAETRDGELVTFEIVGLVQDPDTERKDIEYFQLVPW